MARGKPVVGNVHLDLQRAFNEGSAISRAVVKEGGTIGPFVAWLLVKGQEAKSRDSRVLGRLEGIKKVCPGAGAF